MPWKRDFEQSEGGAAPATGIGAFVKLKPEELDDTVALRNSPGRARPNAYFWLGTSAMAGYAAQADVMIREPKRRFSSLGVTAHRYNLILKGNNMRPAVQSWAPHLRMAKEIRFRSDPDIWYTMKLRVGIEDGAHVRGKV